MPHVLVVDHDPLLAALYKRRFCEEGFKVDIASQGKETMAKLMQNSYDAMVLDLAVPDVDGNHILRRLRKEMRSTIPVVVYANVYVEGEQQSALDAGADAVLSKNEHGPRQAMQKVLELLHERGSETGGNISVEVTQINEKEQLQDMFRLQGVSWLIDARKLAETIESREGGSEELRKIAHQLHLFVGGARIASMSGLALLATAVESLVRHLAEHPRELTASCAETLNNAFDLMEQLLIGSGQTIDPAKAKILVVVSDDAVAEMNGKALKRLGITGGITKNPETALKKYSEQVFDIVIASAEMKPMNGFRFAKALRELPRGHDVPIILVTGISEFAQDFSASSGRAADDLIVKPFPVMELGTKIITHLLASTYFGSGGYIAKQRPSS